MTARDFGLLSLICFCWGLNLVLTRWVVADVPPLFYAFLRFALIGIVLAPWLLPAPRQLGTVALVGLCIGAFNFLFLFLALKLGTASQVALAGQVGLPFTTILSMMFLGERIGWRRGLGMTLAFAGVIIIAWKPEGIGFSAGVVLAILAAFVGSVGGVLMKRMEQINVLTLQAWVAMVSWPVLLVASGATETGQIDAVSHMGAPFWWVVAFSVFGVSIFGHGMFYDLVKRHEVTQIAPLTLMTPVWAVIIGATMLGEPLTPQLLTGGALALTGVFMIAIRPNIRLPDAAALWRRWTA
ncbi:MAG: DMT family transporter [Hyphomonadaceae bacterium]|nr:DMT family transporter [Hyphomonadaceae bacterium]